MNVLLTRALLCPATVCSFLLAMSYQGDVSIDSATLRVIFQNHQQIAGEKAHTIQVKGMSFSSRKESHFLKVHRILHESADRKDPRSKYCISAKSTRLQRSSQVQQMPTHRYLTARKSYSFFCFLLALFLALPPPRHSHFFRKGMIDNEMSLMGFLTMVDNSFVFAR